MSIKTKPGVVAPIFITALFGVATQVYSQDPTPSPTPAIPEAVATTPKSAEENASKVTAASPAPAPEPDFWHRETMSGDWGGTRSRWKEKGVDLEFKLTGFAQGVASGGTRHDTEYNGKFEMWWKFD